MPLLETKGAASAQGFGLTLSSGPVNYIEDVFSTYLYTGNASTQTITNGIDLSTKGGLVWLKSRNYTGDHRLFDTNRGATKFWYSNLTDGEITNANSLTAFNANGFSLGNFSSTNDSSTQYASWTFRKQPKFFDVVTYTGAGGVQTVNHNLGSAPGCIIIKVLNNTGGAVVYHRAMDATIANQYAMFLNSTEARTQVSFWNNTSPTSTSFTVAHPLVNNSGTTYVAYLFAHDAGGFGLSGTDNVISCGSITGTNSLASFNLGYEPQWLLIKSSTTATNWTLYNNMSGWTVDGNARIVSPDLSSAESGLTGNSGPTATGFKYFGASGQTYIYIAIRRGPMKVPTSGTSVFSPISTTATAGTAITTGFPVDMQIGGKNAVAGAEKNWVTDRLRGVSTTATESGALLQTTQIDAENTISVPTRFWSNTGFSVISNVGGASQSYWNFRRAPGFFDEVCYTGTGANTTQTHNLGVVPELIIVKRRNASGAWDTYSAALSNTEYLVVNTTAAKATGATRWNSTTPTSTVFSLGTSTTTNASAGTYVAYLFATCAGVSKVGSYTGTGALQTINCGFTGGSRFVLIKRTDSTGDWYVYDSARGISSGNDPYLLLNTTAAEVTGTNYVDTTSVGFQVTAAAPAGLNANGGTYIFLAIA